LLEKPVVLQTEVKEPGGFKKNKLFILMTD
jgi:hypothetical protein